MLEQVLAAVNARKARKPVYDTYRAYFEGRHDLRFASPDWDRKYGNLVAGLRENLCPAVVSAYTDRLAIIGWGDGADEREAADQGLSRLQNQVHREAFRCGDAYTLTWPGADGTPKARYHRADQIVPHVDELDPDRLDWAAKLWADPATLYGRVNVYLSDRVERFRTVTPLVDSGQELPGTESSWAAMDDDDGPIIGHGFGAVPVCWWRRGDDGPEGYGTSVLADVIPLQAALNKSLADLLVLSETYSKPFWYLLNFRGSEATARNPLLYAQELAAAAAVLPALPGSGPFDPTKQRIFTHDGPGPFGQLEPPDLSRLIGVQQELAAKVARIAGIPSYYFTQVQGDVPSGQSLRVLTSRLLAGVTDFQQSATPVWRGQAQLLGMTDPAPQWADPMPLDAVERHEIAAMKRDLGYPLEDVLRFLDEPDVDGVVARAAQQQQVTAATLGTAFSRGAVPNVGF